MHILEYMIALTNKHILVRCFSGYINLGIMVASDD